jgi:hypothetical protein
MVLLPLSLHHICLQFSPWPSASQLPYGLPALQPPQGKGTGLMFRISLDIRILSVVNSAGGCSALSVNSLNELFPVGSEAVHLFQCP